MHNYMERLEFPNIINNGTVTFISINVVDTRDVDKT